MKLERHGNILQIIFNRPEHRNAYSVAMRDAFYQSLQLLDIDKEIDKVIVSGEGDCFCVGGDINEFGVQQDTSMAHAIRSTHNVAYLLMRHASSIEFHLHRACIGSGIELPAFAHRVVANENSFFQLPEITMGLIPGAGGTFSILRRIGRQRLVHWALSARRIDSETALAWGLIDEIM
jgi:enoyl-CoA hydratase/carnithine racemase